MSRRVVIFVVVLFVVVPGILLAQPKPPKTSPTLEADCSLCHGGSEPDVSKVTEEDVSHSIHADFECLDCHVDADILPHADHLEPVSCGSCHEDELEAYVRHGRGTVDETADLPSCASCHGTHDINPADEPTSRMHPTNQPQACGSCHQDLNLIKKHQILKHPVAGFEASVHDKALLEGKPAPTCVDCHSVDGTAHNLLSASDPESMVEHFRIPDTCGRCHSEVRDAYWDGIHGQLARRGKTNVPVCSDCHGEHGILPTDDPRSAVSPVHVAQATCEPCHESARLNEGYGIGAEELVSFVDSYHGLKSSSGDATVANCASCHNAHLILSSDDPRSSIHASNLAETCGTCHPGITPDLAQTLIHGALTSRGHWPDVVGRIYTWLIILVIGGMAVYVALDYRKNAMTQLRRPQVRRMSKTAVAQHTLLFVSFSTLVITGFALSYSEAGLFRALFGWDGGAATRGIIHRTSAVVFILSCIWHLVYLRSPEGRSFWRGMAISFRDAVEALQTVLYNVGILSKPPRLGRFSYVEKAEYWALLWGSVVMIGTGLFLWFDNLAVRWVSKTFLDVMLVIHLFEAWLAFLAILIWHLYHVLYRPGVYPGNPAWITGKMPRDMHEHEHARDTEARVDENEAAAGEPTAAEDSKRAGVS